jgi:hypothetical protein
MLYRSISVLRQPGPLWHSWCLLCRSRYFGSGDTSVRALQWTQFRYPVGDIADFLFNSTRRYVCLGPTHLIIIITIIIIIITTEESVQLRGGRQTGWSSSPGKGEIFSSRRPDPVLGTTQPPIQWVSFSPGVKRSGREADHSPPTIAEVKNMWRSASTPSYAFIA